MPIMPGREGLDTLRVVQAIKQPALTGTKIRIDKS